MQPKRLAGIGSIDRGEPLVTIGVPDYNGERFRGERLDSLLSQALPDFIHARLSRLSPTPEAHVEQHTGSRVSEHAKTSRGLSYAVVILRDDRMRLPK